MTTAPATLCPKRMRFGPCGGVRPDLSCEVGPVRCPFSSLDEPVSSHDDRVLGEHLVIEGDHDVHYEDAGASRVAHWLEQLPDRQRLVLEQRYGLNDQATHSLAEVAQQLGLTRERVRQIQSEALVRLRGLVEQEERAASQ